MSVGGRGYRGRVFGSGSRTGSDGGENSGNRRTFDEIKIPPDNIGNRVDGEYYDHLANDDAGNSLEGEPAHLKSGILSKLANSQGTRTRGAKHFKNDFRQSGRVKEEPKRNAKPVSPGPDTGERFMARLNADFAKLLNERNGLPFSFSMKPMNDADFAKVEELAEDLDSLGKLIEQVLEYNQIDAEISLSQYGTNAHKFAVFFLKPESSDAVRNKELIAALRQVVNERANRLVRASVNIFLVLANARNVIEEHLTKIGASKIEND